MTDDLIDRLRNPVTPTIYTLDCAAMRDAADEIERLEGIKMSNFGRDKLMAVAAVRYCLGRMTYIVSDCADWLISVWPELTDNTRNIIKRDVEEAFARDDEDRADGSRYYKALGHDCDRAQWERVRELWS